jgi:hypothetical protein
LATFSFGSLVAVLIMFSRILLLINDAWRTNISSVHNNAWQYSVALFYWTAVHSNEVFGVQM